MTHSHSHSPPLLVRWSRFATYLGAILLDIVSTLVNKNWEKRQGFKNVSRSLTSYFCLILFTRTWAQFFKILWRTIWHLVKLSCTQPAIQQFNFQMYTLDQSFPTSVPQTSYRYANNLVLHHKGICGTSQDSNFWLQRVLSVYLSVL